ncbi:MAG TPA: PQQ-binding-like beta-propeller repeat protein [Myxococcota bacterium]|nr:PQQ-binding-like beta-propeller repeat protein [Myxococcota bacterium]HRY94050.1 PQQ-binding-like beta-propeller repeat protein [Myxococcota bacterium]
MMNGAHGTLLVAALALSGLACEGFKDRTYLLPPERAELPEYPAASARHRVLNVLWRHQLMEASGLPLDYSHHGSPAVDLQGTRVYVGSQSGAFSCLDSQTGKVLWRKLGTGPFDGQPVVAGGMVLAGTGGGMLYAFREADGEVLWAHQTTSAIDGRPISAGELVLFTTNSNALTALDLQTGAWRWAYRRDVPAGRFQIKGSPSPLVLGDHVYLGFSDGYLVKLALADGSVLAARKLSEQSARFTDVDSDPVLVGDSLIVGVFGRGVIGLDPEDLKERWVHEADGPSSFAERNGVLFYSTGDSKVEALNVRDNKVLWRFDAKSGSLTAPIAVGPWLLVTSSEQSLMVLDQSSGQLLQVFNPGKGSFSRPSVQGTRAYWVSNGQTLYAMSVVR